MSRSGYSDEVDYIHLYRANVERVLASKRGQEFLQELANYMDDMPEKILIADELINEHGQCCTMGVICKARGIDVSKVDYSDPYAVAGKLRINYMMAAEIAYMNDEFVYHTETPEARWERMRGWVRDNLKSNLPQ